MQVNVKELTGVLHLSLVFMNVLILQSFLAVSFQVSQVSLVFSSVLSSPNSKLPPSSHKYSASVIGALSP